MDANFTAEKIAQKSVSVGVIMASGMIVGWNFKKQKFVALKDECRVCYDFRNI